VVNDVRAGISSQTMQIQQQSENDRYQSDNQNMGWGDMWEMAEPHMGGDQPPPPLPGTDGQPVRASYQLQLQVQALLMSMTDEEKVALGHSQTDLIADCEFAGTTCLSRYVRAKNYGM